MICGKCSAELADRAHFCPHCRSVFMYQGETKEQVAELVRQEYQQYLQQQQELQEQTRKEQQEAWQEIQRAREEIERQREQLEAQQREFQAQQEQMAMQSQQLQKQQQQLARQQTAMQAQQTAQPAMQTVPAKAATQQLEMVNKPVSATAITSLVLGIMAMTTSFLPIVNNWSFVIAVIGLVFAIIGLASTGRLKAKKGAVFAAVGLILSITSIAIVLATQSYYGSVFNQFADRLQHGEKPAATTSSEASVDYSSMAIGQPVTLESGLTVSVVDARAVEQAYTDKAVMCVTVSYVNNGSDSASYNLLDWKSENADGVERSIEIPIGDDSSLDSGKLKPGGTITGNVYFESDATKVYYYSNGLFQGESEICWTL